MYLIEKRIWFLLVAIFSVCFSKAWAQKFKVPLEIKQTKVTLNISHHGGMPISTVQGNPVGSNGNAPAFKHQSELKQTTEPPTNGNFAGATILAGGWRTKLETSEATNITGSIIAGRVNDNMGRTILTLPQSSGGNVKMQWAAIGTPLVSRPVSFLLGGKITPPKINEFGLPLDVDPETYWQPMPHKRYEALSASIVSGGSGYAVDDTVTVSGANDGAAAKFRVAKVESGVVKRVELVGGGSYLGPITEDRTVTAVKNDGAATTASGLVLQVKTGFTKFYWSPHANAAFATQPGIIAVTWIRIAPVTTKDERATYYSLSSSHFALLEKSYVVSGAAVKPFKTIYWTEKQSNGPLVQVPNAQVNAVNIVYNSNFPKRVTAEFSADWVTSLVEDQSQVLQETRTLWFEYGSLHAYNSEGRVFVEYLGAIKENGVDRVHLGFEIVDVRKEANPIDLNVDLGDAITPDGEENPKLYPQPVLKTTMDKPHLHDFTGMDGVRRLYATRETENLNDVLVYWMEKGEQDIRWPGGYSRYKLQWPVEASKYSHYARASESRADAMRSAVQLPPENNPILDYQSKEELNLAAITAEQKFYVHLKAPIEEHRALIRFMGEGRIWFERVYSFLDTWVDDPTSVVHSGVSGSAWFGQAKTEKIGVKPWHFSAPATVGRRIDPPAENNGYGNVSDSGYWAGHIHTATGTSYNPNAYIDPMEKGFEEANQGAIIPVNAIPGQNKLEVWWFRRSEKEGFQPVYWPSVVGTYTVQWPHDAAGYQAESTRNAIVLASNDGSGPLNSLQAKGSIYYKNDPADHGYNPNEEHALIIGGQAYALRDDLNITKVRIITKGTSYTTGTGLATTVFPSGGSGATVDITASTASTGHITAITLNNAGTGYSNGDVLTVKQTGSSGGTFSANYSSSPYVLLEFTGEDGRPEMRAFQVLREQPELGITFDYAVEAGTILQAPMPLPLLDKPLLERVPGQPPISLNKRVDSSTAAGSTINGILGITTSEVKTVLTTRDRHHFSDYSLVSLQNTTSEPVTSLWIYLTEVDYLGKTLEGFVSEKPPVKAGYAANNQPNGQPKRRRYTLDKTSDFNGLQDGDKVAVISSEGKVYWVANFKSNTAKTVDVEFLPDTAPTDSAASGLTLAILKTGITNDDFEIWRVATEPVPANITDATIRASYASFTFQDRKGNLWVYRGSHDATPASYFQVQYYYKTQEGFYFPDVELQPHVGDITPYLRTEVISSGELTGYSPDSSDDDRAKGDANNDKFGDGNSLAVTYRPKWPEEAPVLRMAQTLTKPSFGLPAVRGQTSLEVIYQQSQAKTGTGGVSNKSVILHDSTREKVFELEMDKGAVLHEIPESVNTEIYQGKSYFPNLPPHLVKRFFYDANRGEKGALVFKGEFVDEVVGEDYLLLNVAGSGDLAALKSLCPDSDITNEGKWKKAIDGLKTELELFVHNDAKPGTYLAPDYDKDGTADAGFRTDVGIQNIAEVTDDDQAVDSYALTASGPGIGYVTLLAGNGLAFTATGEPVSLHVIKVVPELHPGEIKVIAADNPLNEKLTMQQTLDLAGEPDNFEFEWKIAPPNDGLEPSVYETQPYLLLADGKWKHVAFPVASDESKVQSDAHFGARAVNEVSTQVIVVSELPYDSVKNNDNNANQLQFDANTTTANRLALGAKVTARLKNGAEVDGTVREVATAEGFSVEFSSRPDPSNVDSVFEQILEGKPQSIVYRTFERPKDTDYKELWLSMNLDDNLGAEVYIDGTQVVRANLDSGNTEATSAPVTIQDALRKSWRVPAGPVSVGAESGDVKTHRVMVKLYSSALPGAPLDFNLRLHGITVQDQTSVAGSQWKALEPKRYPDGVRAVIGGEADVQALSDNYLTMRYKAKDSTNYPAESKQYSLWTEPQLAEGWIKRVLAGINPFHQRAKNLFNNRVDTGVSMLTQAGPRWEGDVALNMDNINDFGLIEIYETVLNRGKMLSIDAGSTTARPTMRCCWLPVTSMIFICSWATRRGLTLPTRPLASEPPTVNWAAWPPRCSHSRARYRAYWRRNWDCFGVGTIFFNPVPAPLQPTTGFIGTILGESTLGR